MTTIASILRDGEDPSMPALRGWLQDLAASVSAAQLGLRTFDNKVALDAHVPAGSEPIYAFVADGTAFKGYRYSNGWIADDTFYQGMSAIVQALVMQAQTAASQAAAASAAMVPLCTAATSRNDAAVTVYAVTVPAGIDAGRDGQKFSFVVPATSLGATIRLDVTNAGLRDAFFTAGRRLRAGWVATFSANNGGGRWSFETQIPSDVSLSSLEETVQSGTPGLQLAIGVPLASPINGNPDDIFVPFTGWANDAAFEALIVKTNTTDNPIITVPDHRVELRDAPAGSLVAGQIARFVISAGVNAMFLRGSRPLLQLSDLGGALPDPWNAIGDPVYAPYGNVTRGSNGKPVFASRVMRAVGRGSSVSTDPNSGRNGASPVGQAPVKFLADTFAAAFGPYLAIRPDNWSHGGHVARHGDGQWAEAMAQDPAAPAILMDCFGMNDLSPYGYNSGQTAEYLRNPIYYEAELRRRAADGVKMIVLCTTPHPHTGRYPYNLDGVAMTWPYDKPSPVTPDEIVPPAAQSVANRDWTGGGVVCPGDVRAGHVNAMIRTVARRLHLDPALKASVVLLDVEWAWFRYGVEVRSLDQLYNAGEIVHPNLLGHQVSYQRCIREFVAAMRRGRGDQWCFRGEAGS